MRQKLLSFPQKFRPIASTPLVLGKLGLQPTFLIKSQGHQKWKLHITQLFCEYPFIVILSLFLLSFLVKTILKTIEDYHWKYIFCSTILVFGLFFFVLFVLEIFDPLEKLTCWSIMEKDLMTISSRKFTPAFGINMHPCIWRDSVSTWIKYHDNNVTDFHLLHSTQSLIQKLFTSLFIMWQICISSTPLKA